MAPLPTLRQLTFLTALADELHFGRAAERCQVTQSTLSAGLKELETILDVALAERTKRSVILTEAGKAVAERARLLLRDAETLVEVAQAGKKGYGGTIRLGAIPTIGPFLLPRLIRSLSEDPQGPRLLLREDLTPGLLEGVQDGRLDAVVAALPYDIGELEHEVLFEDDYVLACRLDHPLAGSEVVDGPALAGERLLLLERGHCLQQHALTAFPDVQLHEEMAFSATSLGTLVAMVSEGIGITLLPRLAVAAGLTEGYELALRPVKGAYARQVVLAWRKTSTRGAALSHLAQALRAARSES